MTLSPRKNAPPSSPAALLGGRIALWLVVGVFILFHVYFNILSLRDYVLTDFHIYHEALGRAARGEPVYDLSVSMPFLYPPFFLILLWPMGWLSEPAAMTVWLYLQNGFLIISLAALLAIFRPIGSSLVAWTLVLFTGFSPVMLNNLYGQMNLLYLAILSLFAWAYAESAEPTKRPWVWEIIAALILSLAISIRVLPIVLLALAVFQRRYRIALLAVGFVALEAVAAGAVIGLKAEWQYFTVHIFGLRGLKNMREISLLALLQQIVGSPRIALSLFALLLAAAFAAFLVWVYGPMRRRTSSVALHIAFAVASMVLFAPLLEYHHYTILLAAYALVLGNLAQRNRLNLTSALPVFLSWAYVSAANQLSHFQFAAVAFVALASTALIWVYSIRLIVRDERPPESV